MPVMILDGRPLIVDGKVAVSEDCCCIQKCPPLSCLDGSTADITQMAIEISISDTVDFWNYDPIGGSLFLNRWTGVSSFSGTYITSRSLPGCEWLDTSVEATVVVNKYFWPAANLDANRCPIGPGTFIETQTGITGVATPNAANQYLTINLSGQTVFFSPTDESDQCSSHSLEASHSGYSTCISATIETGSATPS